MKLIWNQVETMEQLQEWLVERELSISNLQTCFARSRNDPRWECDISSNTFDSGLAKALGLRESDDLDSNSVGAVGMGLRGALLAAMLKVDILLGLAKE